jgi:hypothetical protein
VRLLPLGVVLLGLTRSFIPIITSVFAGWRAGQDNNLWFAKQDVYGRLLVSGLLAYFSANGEFPVHLSGLLLPTEFVMAYLTYKGLKDQGAW